MADSHNPQRDRELGMDRPITRRDFMDGVAVAIGAASLLPQSAEAATNFPQDRPGYDPPTLTGMRGSHEGSYDYAHALRDGAESVQSLRVINPAKKDKDGKLEGLQDGERVIISGMQRVHPGTVVTAKPDAPPKPPGFAMGKLLNLTPETKEGTGNRE